MVALSRLLLQAVGPAATLDVTAYVGQRLLRSVLSLGRRRIPRWGSVHRIAADAPAVRQPHVDVPRERVFDYLSDIANHSAFADHYLKDFRLERLDSRGVGAAASYKIAFPLGATWGDCVIRELEAPYLIRIEGQMGRLGRIKTEAVYELTQAGNDMTRVEYRFRGRARHPGRPPEGAARAARRGCAAKSRRALRRLASDPRGGGASGKRRPVAAG